MCAYCGMQNLHVSHLHGISLHTHTGVHIYAWISQAQIHFACPLLASLQFLPSQVPLSVPSNPVSPAQPHSSTASSTRDILTSVQSGMEELILTHDDQDHSPPNSSPLLPSTLTTAPVTVVRSPGHSVDQTTLPDQHLATPQPTSTSNDGGEKLVSAAQSMNSTQLLVSTTPTAHSGQVQPQSHSGQVQPQSSYPGSQHTTYLPSQASPLPAIFSSPGVSQGVTMHHSPAVSTILPITAASTIPLSATTGPTLPYTAVSQSGLTSLPSAGQVPVTSQTTSGLPTLPQTISFPTTAPKISFSPTPPFLPPATTS